jgi:hypothetical protein
MTIASPYSSIDVSADSQTDRSLLRRFADFVTAGRQQKASAALARYLYDHQQSLAPEVRAELERHLSNS